MNPKALILASLFFFVNIKGFSLEILAKTKPPLREAPSGIWLLDTAGELFKNSLTIGFYMQGKELQARKVLQDKERREKLSTLFQEGNTKDRATYKKKKEKPLLIWNLREKNGEYLYGWLRAEKTEKPYRCKLWQRQNKLFLRVYKQGLYSTYELKPIHIELSQ